jgi:hypothetical protein
MSDSLVPARNVGRAVMPRVRVAIVNYKTADLVVDCLRSLVAEREQWPGLEVVVADNASPDASSAHIKQAIAANGWGGWVRVLDLPENGGFAYGNNAIMQDRSTPEPDYHWLLNPDTIVRPGALAGLVAVAQREPRAGIIGSCLEWPDGTQQCSAFRFHTIGTELASSFPLGPFYRRFDRWVVAPAPERRTARHDWLSGASLLLKASMVREVGYLDDGYFLYYEETDYCLKARRRGWECWLSAESRVVHLVGQSTGVDGAPSLRAARRPAYWFEARRRYFEKNHGKLYALGADLALATSVIAAKAAAAVRRRGSGIPERFLADMARHSVVAAPRQRQRT